MGKKTHYKTAVSFSNYKQICDCISKIPASTKNAINIATKETANRAKPKIKKAVTSFYGISPSDMKQENDKAKVVKDGKIKINGNKVNNYSIKYDGRLLTPLHFKMNPASRPEGKRYKVKATIIKGQRKAIKRMPTFLSPAAFGNETIIPFQRHKGEWHIPTRGAYAGKKSKRTGKPILKERIEPVKTISVPQMITNKNVKDKYIPEINEELQKRVTHQIEREFARSQRAIDKTSDTIKKNLL